MTSTSIPDGSANSNGGGFFPPPSGPAAMTPPASSTAGSSATAARLPPPRSKPLKTGGPKESALIRYVDERIRQMQRRYAKRETSAPPPSGAQQQHSGGGEGVQGYANLREACRDIEQLVDVVWVSGTPGLQIAYLLSLADLVNEFMKGFPVAPAPLFGTLEKLDHAFASLLLGADVETGEALPGFAGGWRVSATERVRVNSMVQYARSAVVDVMLRYDPEMDEEDGEEEGEETAEESGVEDLGDVVLEGGEGDEGEVEGTWDMKTAKVFDKTLVELGDDLTNAPPIGLRVEKPEMEACRPRESNLEDSDRVMELD